MLGADNHHAREGPPVRKEILVNADDAHVRSNVALKVRGQGGGSAQGVGL
jgi:hypothetical protein